MTDKELEQALHSALKPTEPGENFSSRVLARLHAQQGGPSPVDAAADLSAAGAAHSHTRQHFRRWSAPAALAACAMVAVGLVYWRHQVEQQRGAEARAQLLQALSIAGAQVNNVRTAVLRVEQPVE